MALATLELAEQQKGAGAFERHRKPVVVSERHLGHADSTRDIPARSQQHAAGPRPDSEHPRPVQPAAVGLNRIDQRLGLVETTQRYQSRDSVGNVTRRHDLGARHLIESGDQRLQGRQCLGVIAERNLQEPQADRRPVGKPRGTAPLRELDCPAGGLTGLGFAAGVSADDSPNRHPDDLQMIAAELLCALDGFLGDRRRFGVSAAPDLDQRREVRDEYEVGFGAAVVQRRRTIDICSAASSRRPAHDINTA